MSDQSEMLKEYIGYTITGFVTDEICEEPVTGLVLQQLDHDPPKETVFWILKDPEGNGAGWVDPQDE